MVKELKDFQGWNVCLPQKIGCLGLPTVCESRFSANFVSRSETTAFVELRFKQKFKLLVTVCSEKTFEILKTLKATIEIEDFYQQQFLSEEKIFEQFIPILLSGVLHFKSGNKFFPCSFNRVWLSVPPINAKFRAKNIIARVCSSPLLSLFRPVIQAW